MYEVRDYATEIVKIVQDYIPLIISSKSLLTVGGSGAAGTGISYPFLYDEPLFYLSGAGAGAMETLIEHLSGRRVIAEMDDFKFREYGLDKEMRHLRELSLSCRINGEGRLEENPNDILFGAFGGAALPGLPAVALLYAPRIIYENKRAVKQVRAAKNIGREISNVLHDHPTFLNNDIAIHLNKEFRKMKDPDGRDDGDFRAKEYLKRIAWANLAPIQFHDMFVSDDIID